MRVLALLFAILALGFFGLIPFNLYEYHFEKTVPWREGDLREVITRCLAYGSLFAVGAVICWCAWKKVSR